ncbi:hypothetical protein LCGC14_1516380 [marine sediment metagenome]|uniref:PurE domain-containing protein n=1 Tax=marine sediment metagenome TaxID=412755 RepID=A0A0F9J036_9ZZZZ
MSVQVGLIMGSQSDWSTMREAAEILTALGVSFEKRIVSAHRTPDRLWDYGKSAAGRGVQVIIAGAGGAAHLPGMVASKTHLPVIGVPVQTKALGGLDSLYSIVQMPRGFPVATMAIGAAGVVILTAGYILWTVQRVLLGPEYKGPHGDALKPMNRREVAIAAPLLGLAIFFGVCPNAILQYTAPSINRTIDSLGNWTKQHQQSQHEQASTQLEERQQP